jgi:hypothetical protein
MWPSRVTGAVEQAHSPLSAPCAGVVTARVGSTSALAVDGNAGAFFCNHFLAPIFLHPWVAVLSAAAACSGQGHSGHSFLIEGLKPRGRPCAAYGCSVRVQRTCAAYMCSVRVQHTGAASTRSIAASYGTRTTTGNSASARSRCFSQTSSLRHGCPTTSVATAARAKQPQRSLPRSERDRTLGDGAAPLPGPALGGSDRGRRVPSSAMAAPTSGPSSRLRAHVLGSGFSRCLKNLRAAGALGLAIREPCPTCRTGPRPHHGATLRAGGRARLDRARRPNGCRSPPSAVGGPKPSGEPASRRRRLVEDGPPGAKAAHLPMSLRTSSLPRSGEAQA